MGADLSTSVEHDAHLATYWGKADPAVALESGSSHHTVLGHSLDVAACAYVLVERHDILKAQLADGTGLPVEFVGITVAAVCALHDVGKLDTRFQRKAPAVADLLRPHTANVAAGRYDHGTEGFRQIMDEVKAIEQVEGLLGSSGLDLLRAVCGHHGSFPSNDGSDPSWTRLPPSVRREDVAARRYFVKRIGAFFLDRGAALPWAGTVDGAVVQRVGGICALVDWLGSSTSEFPYLPGTISDIGDYWQAALARAATACERAGLVRATSASLRFDELFPGYAPRDVQLLTERTPTDEPALIIVEAEMGKGKTEAALAMAARFLAAGTSDGITIGLPTMATSNAMFRRVEAVASRLFPSQPVQVALAHSRASRNPHFQSLVQRALRAQDLDAAEASVVCARWLLSRKRVLLAQIGVGTIDQALQAALVVRHQFVRMFGLSRNVVVIDEVHAYDAYMEVLLEHLLSWLGALHVPVILLSATLPSARRMALTRAWQGQGLGDEEPDADDMVTATARAYPLVTVATRGAVSTMQSDDPSVVRTFDLENAEADADEDEQATAVALRLLTAARAGARVVWIRNTVREAQRAFRAVLADSHGVEVMLFHARFRGCDRSAIEQVVLERFGKEAPAGGRVLIATQVVEQSLDLDFDVMHTDLAPVDLVFQRAGRLHRHVRPRLPGFEQPRLVVHTPSASDIEALRFGPSRYVYDAGTLWLAARVLRTRTTLQLPTDIRPFVEYTYHPASRAAELPLGGHALVAAEKKRAYELVAKQVNARRCCIPTTSLSPDGEPTLADDEDAVQAFTRDGKSLTLLPFLWDGTSGRSLDRPNDAAWVLCADRTSAWRLAAELTDQTLSVPARTDMSGAVFASDSAAWTAWRRQFVRFADESGLGARVEPFPMRPFRDQFKGWLRVGGKLRRALYSRTLGLIILSKKDEEQAR